MMDKGRIIQCLFDVLGLEKNTDYSNLSEKSKLTDLGLTSLQFIEFILKIEKEFNIEVLDSDLLLDKFETIELMFQTLEKYFLNLREYKKCLILDCDNVLWKGVSGEEQITIDDDILQLHRLIIDLYARGVLLCLCSKNLLFNVSSAINSSKSLLSLEHFIECKVNQRDKASSIIDIACELNLGIDCFVFVDDSDYEIGFVKSVLPEVTVIKADYSSQTFLKEIDGLFPFEQLANLNRTELYREQKAREKIKQQGLSIEEYNESLQTSICCHLATADELSRLSELSQRTHQFNLSDKHYSKEEMQTLYTNPKYSILSLAASDRYGDMGVVGMAVLNHNTIEAFAISCRVFDRGFEYTLLDLIKNIADPNVDLLGIFVDNVKNSRFATFYSDNGVHII